MKKVLIIIIFILIITGCRNKIDNSEIKEVEFKNITYREENNGYACITFFEDSKYSMYDCDSEPTNYFFDSENECTYKYTGEKIYFDCKYNFQEHKNNYIEIIEWNEQIFKFGMDEQIKIFKAIDNN